ncbi:MAG: hypothetical protein ACLUE2_19885 [Bacteroides cellulosilyticus]
MGSRLSEKFKDDYAVISIDCKQWRDSDKKFTIYRFHLCLPIGYTLPDYSLESVLMEVLRIAYLYLCKHWMILFCCAEHRGMLTQSWNFLETTEYTNLHACADGVIYFKNSRRSEEKKDLLILSASIKAEDRKGVRYMRA